MTTIDRWCRLYRVRCVRGPWRHLLTCGLVAVAASPSEARREADAHDRWHAGLAEVGAAFRRLA